MTQKQPDAPNLKIQKCAHLPAMHRERRPEVAMLVCPGVTLLDILGPQTVLAPSCNIHLVWKNTHLIETDSGVVLKPALSFSECPHDLDVLLVGGCPLDIFQDAETLQFLADQGSRAKYVTSVCSGSLVLGAAGLLQGYRATSHWSMLKALRLFGATPVEARVVTDRNRVSGGGVTAGIDFGLEVLSQLLGEEIARLTQLAMEYDPAPPFDSGSPKKAGPALAQKVHDWMGPEYAERMAGALAEAAKSMNTSSS